MNAPVALEVDELVSLCYAQMKRAARRERRRWPQLSDPQTTELVSSAYLKLARSRRWRSVDEFMAASARAAREVLVDDARARTALKRGGRDADLPLHEVAEPADEQQQADQRLLDMDTALAELEQLDERLARLVECRFFAGYTEAETAQILELSDRTVRREWIKARAWLQQRLAVDEALSL